MLLLSQLVDRQHCGDADTEVLDDILGFGKFMAEGNPGHSPTVAVLSEWIKAAADLRALPGFRSPLPAVSRDASVVVHGELFNDLYLPGLRVADGVHHVHIPVIGAPRSSEGVATDYAFLLLASLVVPNPEATTVIIEAWWPDGRVVRGVPERSTWNAAEWLARAGQLKNRKRITGPACHRCLNRKECKTFQALDDVMMLAPADKSSAKTEAQRLWLEWIMLKDFSQKEDAKKKAVTKRLMELSVNGEVDVNGLLKLRVEQQERSYYDAAQVMSILQPAGLWQDKFASIKNGELNKAMSTFPAAVRAQLERVAKTEKIEPTLREAAAGTARTVYDIQVATLSGIHLQS
jgi:hypothetical protein